LRQAYDYWQDQPGNFVVSNDIHQSLSPLGQSSSTNITTHTLTAEAAGV